MRPMSNQDRIYLIPSSSDPNKKYEVIVRRGQVDRCSCPATKECKHMRLVKVWLGYIEGSTNCFYTGSSSNLEEHHLFRGGLRQKSLTIYLSHWIHERVTHDKEFEEHLTNLFFNPIMINELNLKAIFKQLSAKTLLSGDRAWRVIFETEDINEAQKVFQLGGDTLYKINFEDKKFYAVNASCKINKADNKATLVFDCPPAERGNAAIMALSEDKEITITL